jgi:hypothetical protein
VTGVYIRCDGCGATIDGVEVTRPDPPLSKFGGPTLIAMAAERGWTRRPESKRWARDDKDWCPDCTAKRLSK